MTSLTNLLIPTYKHTLQHLSAWLDKASDYDDSMLLRRLAPDMFPLASQVRFVCLQAQEAVYRLQEQEIPAHLVNMESTGRSYTQGSSVQDTLADAKSMIQQALAFLEALTNDALDQNGIAKRTMKLELPGSMVFELTGEQYVRDWALPQFYFHLVVAYSILRNAGVELGKADYVPHMFQYLSHAVKESTSSEKQE